MKSFLFLFLLVPIAKVYAQSVSFIEYKDTTIGFSIKVPTGWRYGPNSTLKLIAVRPIADSSDKSREYFNLNILDRKSSSLEREYEKLLRALASTYDFNLSKEGNTTINGQPFKWLIETHKTPNNAANLTNYVFITYKSGKTFILTLVSLSNDFERMEPLFKEIAESLVISNCSQQRFGAMVATEYVLVDSNSIQLLYIGPATLTRTATTAPSRGTLAAMANVVETFFVRILQSTCFCFTQTEIPE